MRKILFNDKYGLTFSVINGLKTQTRRFTPIYKACEDLAVATKYSNIKEHLSLKEDVSIEDICKKYSAQKGWNNKMFVKAELMPYKIHLIAMRIEKLQDISNYDCMQEGIITDGNFFYTFIGSEKFYHTPQDAYSALINKVCGTGTWEKNPITYVYDFYCIKNE